MLECGRRIKRDASDSREALLSEEERCDAGTNESMGIGEVHDASYGYCGYQSVRHRLRKPRYSGTTLRILLQRGKYPLAWITKHTMMRHGPDTFRMTTENSLFLLLSLKGHFHQNAELRLCLWTPVSRSAF